VIRWHIFFSGRVQGVGFRYTSRQVAGRYEVAGWVKNLPNGTVEMIAEGPSGQLKKYVADVSESTHGHVADMQVTKSNATGEFSAMEIRH
jgi:acylphosphatase